MLQYERITASKKKKNDINRSNKLKECIIWHYWYFKDIGCKFEPYVGNDCHNISMMAYGLGSIAISNIKSVSFGCSLWNITRNDAINRLNNSELDD